MENGNSLNFEDATAKEDLFLSSQMLISRPLIQAFQNFSLRGLEICTIFFSLNSIEKSQNILWNSKVRLTLRQFSIFLVDLDYFKGWGSCHHWPERLSILHCSLLPTDSITVQNEHRTIWKKFHTCFWLLPPTVCPNLTNLILHGLKGYLSLVWLLVSPLFLTPFPRGCMQNCFCICVWCWVWLSFWELWKSFFYCFAQGGTIKVVGVGCRHSVFRNLW